MPAQDKLIREVPLLDKFRESLPDKAVKEAIRHQWHEYLDKFAPPGVSSRDLSKNRNGINDAYRHYMSAAEIARMSGGGEAGVETAWHLGYLNELINNAYSSQSTEMDFWNNYAGTQAGKSSGDPVENSIAFINDVIQGKIKVIDKDGRIRETSVRDLPHYDGDAVEDRYRPDKGGGMDDPTGVGETMIA